MSEVAIRVEGLSKAYRIGARQERHDTLRDAIADFRLKMTDSLRRRGNLESDRDFWALKDVSFEVKTGEVVGVIGRNGAGKSTLLKILSRITEPTEGRAEIHGRVGSLLEVGTGFHPELTGRENIFLNGAILGMRRTEIAAKFDEIVAFSEIEKFLDTPVKRYSSGMYVRLAFAVAAHLEPEILLVDEVLAVGDAAFQRRCLGKMDAIAHEGRTIIFVSHSMPAILSLCSRAALLAGGTKRFDGPAQKTVEKYLQSDTPQLSDSHIQLNPELGFTSQRALITGLQIKDTTGAAKRRLAIGEAINLHVELSLLDQLDHPAVGVGVDDALGVRVTTLTTRFQGIELPPLVGHHTIECYIDGINLAPGPYSLKIVVGNRHEDLCIATVRNAFSVVESDFWGSGKLPNSTQGRVLTSAKWSIVR